jgi:hypothetical protein
MVRVESRMGEMAHTVTPVRGYRTGESHAIWPSQPRVQAQAASRVSATPKKPSCKTCSGEGCIGLCRS